MHAMYKRSEVGQVDSAYGAGGVILTTTSNNSNVTDHDHVNTDNPSER